MAKDIRERAFDFAVRIVKLCSHLEKNSNISRNLTYQLTKAGTSIGANPEEAQAAQSKADFIHKNSISLKEAREAKYWLRLILATGSFDKQIGEGIVELEQDSIELLERLLFHLNDKLYLLPFSFCPTTISIVYFI